MTNTCGPTCGTSCGAEEVDICFTQGDSFEVLLEFVDHNAAKVDISAMTIQSQIRDNTIDGSGVIAEFAVAIVGVNTATLTLTPTQTEPMDPLLKYAWDVKATEAGTTTTFARGVVTVIATSTSPTIP